MKFGYRFSNLLGTVYSRGNLLFTPDGNNVISPVGNRITVFDLVNHTSITLPVQTRRDINIMALSPNGRILLASDEEGQMIIVNMQMHVQLGTYKFKHTPATMEFSPNGQMIAIGVDNRVFIYKSPLAEKSLNPMVRLSHFQHAQNIASLDWADDSKKLLITCKGGVIFIREANARRSHMFQVHGSESIHTFFGNSEGTVVHSVTRKGLLQWKFYTDEELLRGGLIEPKTEDGNEVSVTTQSGNVSVATAKKENATTGRWRYEGLKQFDSGMGYKVKCARYHKRAQLLVVGYNNGQFTLYRMPDNQELYKLNISSHSISSVAFNNTGEWLAFGCKDLGQLLVWEWRSETYILKQQGHAYNMSALSYSPDGQNIATGGDDAKVKVWNTTSGYCFVTFSDHEAPVTAVQFSPVASQNAVYSASLDGTVRAYDLLRYRNFRTFVSPNKTQFGSLAIDPAGEIVVAGSTDTFEIYVWSIRTGRLTDVLAGHTSPVSSLSFDPINSLLVSGSWDKTVKIWDIYDDGATKETIQNKSDVLAVAYSPDGQRLACSTLDGSIQIFETANWTQMGIIDGRNDITGGRGANDHLMAKTNPAGRAFTHISFTPNGQCLIAGGDSKYICIYHVEQAILLKKYQTSGNLSLDGILDLLDWRKLTEFGHADLMDRDFEDGEQRKDDYLPGVKRGDMSKRNTKKKIKTYGLAMSPTGRAWAATTTEGLMVYSLDENLFFDPTDLSIDINSDTIRATLADKEYLRALIMSLRLNEKPLIEEVYEAIPPNHVAFVCHEFPLYYLKNFIQFLSYNFDRKPHLEFQMNWILHLLTYHGKYIKSNSNSMIESLRNLQKGLAQQYSDLSQVCDDNRYTLEYFAKIASLPRREVVDVKDEKVEDMQDDDDDADDMDDNIYIAQTR
ncbi:hypothetical protein SAMD00019534_021880 [Acytostelium subglobosum LB1]|uniref:hypothetical protein n=1 Tax=Acytostelium subglobosum LB1 TaxID=1410327 RepID=UPI00064484F0|nr:hypothetical protein SAMD00019534_021880 [Acytostelium subglobosum LB1]GAM19013.1 hypothetical protein SAMD00019534_021880 [Acytostelium subglobosum LB1]|eukprot:XP_012756940.1 hypothetical protein SAMD00019534_021880 [Acytostelium subglobosum LB1]